MVNGNDILGDPYLDLSVDKKFKDDPSIIVNDDYQMSYNEMVDNFPVNKFIASRVLISWDDVMQYTSLGLMEALNALYKLNVNIDVDAYFQRPNEFHNGMDLVYFLFKDHLSKEKIDKVKEKFYWKILQFSLRSTVYRSVFNVTNFFKEIILFFPFRFPELPLIIQGINESLNTSNKFKLSYFVESEISFKDVIVDKQPNAIIHGDLTMVYDTILENNIYKVALLGPENHNNLSDDTLKLLSKIKQTPLPNYCSIHLYEEQMVLPEI